MQLKETFNFPSAVQSKYYLNAEYKRLSKIKLDKTNLLTFYFNYTFNDFIQRL